MTRSAAFLLGVRALLPMLLGAGAPALLMVGAVGLINPRFWADLVAIAVAARWKNTLLTIASGFAALWLLRWLI